MMFLKSVSILMLIGALIGCGTPTDIDNEPQPPEGTREPQSTQSPEDISAQAAADAEHRIANREAEKIETLQKQLAQVEQRHRDIATRVSEKQNDISSLRSLLVTTENEISAFEGKIQSYMSDNMMPVACIGAAGVALDEGNQFESDAEEIAGAVTVVCALMLLDGVFANQVINVVDTLNQSDIHNRNLIQKAENIRDEISEKSVSFSSDEAMMTEADLKMQMLESELDELLFQ